MHRRTISERSESGTSETIEESDSSAVLDLRYEGLSGGSELLPPAPVVAEVGLEKRSRNRSDARPPPVLLVVDGPFA